MNLQSRLVMNGVSYENGQKFIKQFLSILGKENLSEKNKSVVSTTSSANNSQEEK